MSQKTSNEEIKSARVGPLRSGSVRTPVHVLRSVSEKIGHYFDASRVLFARLDEQQANAEVIYEWIKPDLEAGTGVYPFADFLSKDLAQTLGSGQVVNIADATRDPRLSSHLFTFRRFAIRSFLIVPYIRFGRARFIVAVARSEPSSWHTLDTELLRETAEKIFLRYERASVEEALGRAIEFDEAILLNMNEGLLTVDQDGRVVAMNPAAEESLGWKRDELQGKDLHETIHFRHRDGSLFTRDECPTLGVLQTGVPVFDKDTVFIRKDGSFFDVRFSSSPLVESGKAIGLVIVFRDVTERKREQENSEFLSAIGEKIRKGRDAKDLLADISESLGKYLGVHRCLFNEIDLESDTETVPSDYSRTGESVTGKHKISEYSSIASASMKAGETVVNQNSQIDPRTASLFEKTYGPNKEVAYVAVPMLRSGKWVASLWCSDDRPRNWTRDEIALLEQVAERAWSAVERIRSEEAIARLAAIVEFSEDAIISKDLNGIIKSWNHAAERLFGYTPDEAIGKPITLVIPPDRLDEEPAILHKIRRNEPVDHFETVRRRKDGTLLDISLTISPIRDIQGRVIGASKVARDITERKRAERALRESQTRLADELLDTKILQKISMELISEQEAEGLYEQILDAAMELMKSDAASIQILDHHRGKLRLLASKNFHPDSAAHWEWIDADSITTCGRALATGARIVMTDTETSESLNDSRDLEEYRRSHIRSMQSTPLTSRSGLPLGMISTHWSKPHRPSGHDFNLLDVLARQAADLIERATAESALRRSEEKYKASENQLRLITDNIPALIAYVGADERYKFVNGTYSEWFGQPTEYFLGKKIQDVIGVRAYKSIRSHMERAFAGETVNFEAFVNYKLGGARFVSGAYVPDIADDGSAAGFYALTNDITELKRSEELLRSSQERMQMLTESFTDYAIFSTDIEGIIDSWNPGAENIFGYKEAEIVGKSCEILFTPEDVGRGMPVKEMRNARNSGRASDERWLVRKNGTRFFASGVMAPLFVGRALTGYAKIAMDLTERKRTAEALQRAHDEMEMRVLERTRELAEANAALLAEISERKTAERQKVELLQRLVTTQEDERRRIARDIHDQLGQRLTALRLKIASLKELCGNDEVLRSRTARLEEIGQILDSEVNFLAWELRPTALDELGLKDAIGTYVREWSVHYETAAEFHSIGIANVRLDSDADIQLYRIAQEALNNIAKHAQATKVNVLLEKKDGKAVLILEDNGIGFTPKDDGKVQKSGKGLGLRGMGERASLIGGHLEIESTPGKGTTIYASVPINGKQR